MPGTTAADMRAVSRDSLLTFLDVLQTTTLTDTFSLELLNIIPCFKWFSEEEMPKKHQIMLVVTGKADSRDGNNLVWIFSDAENPSLHKMGTEQCVRYGDIHWSLQLTL